MRSLRTAFSLLAIAAAIGCRQPGAPIPVGAAVQPQLRFLSGKTSLRPPHETPDYIGHDPMHIATEYAFPGSFQSVMEAAEQQLLPEGWQKIFSDKSDTKNWNPKRWIAGASKRTSACSYWEPSGYHRVVTIWEDCDAPPYSQTTLFDKKASYKEGWVSVDISALKNPAEWEAYWWDRHPGLDHKKRPYEESERLKALDAELVLKRTLQDSHYVGAFAVTAFSLDTRVYDERIFPPARVFVRQISWPAFKKILSDELLSKGEWFMEGHAAYQNLEGRRIQITSFYRKRGAGDQKVGLLRVASEAVEEPVPDMPYSTSRAVYKPGWCALEIH